MFWRLESAPAAMSISTAVASPSLMARIVRDDIEIVQDDQCSETADFSVVMAREQEIEVDQEAPGFCSFGYSVSFVLRTG
ncbi:hypothetical protein MA16_Dca017673 [Dendrobium catenatum]|uniref:Uncharacterized protein n=1 Tax=Dendrobium catenatum TaxID=906689 RepID=A0A2I0XAC9_9ASPA|nr:hypothetical protein MA16_Dca017673 [Dendrobium catenatum]